MHASCYGPSTTTAISCQWLFLMIGSPPRRQIALLLMSTYTFRYYHLRCLISPTFRDIISAPHKSLPHWYLRAYGIYWYTVITLQQLKPLAIFLYLLFNYCRLRARARCGSHDAFKHGARHAGMRSLGALYILPYLRLRIAGGDMLAVAEPSRLWHAFRLPLYLRYYL